MESREQAVETRVVLFGTSGDDREQGKREGSAAGHGPSIAPAGRRRSPPGIARPGHRPVALARHSASAAGFGPPVAQSSNSTVWTIGMAGPAPMTVLSAILPGALQTG